MAGSGPTMTEESHVILDTAFVAWMAPAITEGRSGGLVRSPKPAP